MLPKAQRLTAKTDFEKVKRHGLTLTSPLFVISWRARSELRPNPSPRLGFVASRRLEKRATARNRAKRVLREAVRLWLKSQSPLGPGANLDIVFILRQGILKADYEAVRHWVDSLLPKVFKF